MMNSIIRLVIISVVAVLFYALSSILVESVYSRQKFIAGAWEKEPLVVICRDSKIRIATVLNAINYWETKGFKTDHYIVDYENYVCSQSFPIGFIIIRHEGEMPEDSIGVTRRMIVSGTVVSAEIIIPNDEVNVPLILEHELGHALGLNHISIPGHIMHPFIDRAGDKFWIP